MYFVIPSKKLSRYILNAFISNHKVYFKMNWLHKNKKLSVGKFVISGAKPIRYTKLGRIQFTYSFNISSWLVTLWKIYLNFVVWSHCNVSDWISTNIPGSASIYICGIFSYSNDTDRTGTQTQLKKLLQNSTQTEYQKTT